MKRLDFQSNQNINKTLYVKIQNFADIKNIKNINDNIKNSNVPV